MEIKFKDFKTPGPIKHRASFEKYMKAKHPTEYKELLKTNGLNWEHTFSYSLYTTIDLFDCWKAAKKINE